MFGQKNNVTGQKNICNFQNARAKLPGVVFAGVLGGWGGLGCALFEKKCFRSKKILRIAEKIFRATKKICTLAPENMFPDVGLGGAGLGRVVGGLAPAGAWVSSGSVSF